MNDLDDFDGEVLFQDDIPTEFGNQQRANKNQARQRYDQMMEEKRLKQQIEDELCYW